MRRFRQSLLLRLAIPALLPLALSAQERITELSLNDAIRAALAKNYTIKAQAAGTRASAAELAAEWGTFHPGFQARYDYNSDGSPQPTDPFSGNRPPSSIVETDSGSIGIGGVTPWGLNYSLSGYSQNQRGTFNSFADNYYTFAGIELTQPILRGFGWDANLVGVRLARATRDSERWAYRAAVMNIVTATLNAYLELDFAQKNLEITQRSRDLAQGLLEDNEKRFNAGWLSEADVTSARTRVATRQENILFAQRAVSLAQNALKSLISDDNTPDLLAEQLSITRARPLPDHEPNPATEFALALDRRPDYQQARLNVSRADANRRFRRNQLLPRVDLVGSLGYNGLDPTFSGSRDQVLDRDSRSYSVGVVFNSPITFATERGRYRAAKFTQEQAELLLAQTEQEIVVSLGNAADNIETTRQRVRVTRQSLELAEQALEAERKKLQAGTGSTFIVLEQQEILARIEISAYRAEIDHQRALAEYNRQLGLTLQAHGITIEGDTETTF